MRMSWHGRIGAVLLLASLTVNCASVDFGLYRSGGTEEDFSRDETECRKSLGLGGASRFDTSQILVFFISRYKDEMRSCLQQKGWRLRPAGM